MVRHNVIISGNHVFHITLAHRICVWNNKLHWKTNHSGHHEMVGHGFLTYMYEGHSVFLSLRCQSKKYKTDLRRMCYMSPNKSPL